MGQIQVRNTSGRHVFLVQWTIWVSRMNAITKLDDHRRHQARLASATSINKQPAEWMQLSVNSTRIGMNERCALASSCRSALVHEGALPPQQQRIFICFSFLSHSLCGDNFEVDFQSLRHRNRNRASVKFWDIYTIDPERDETKEFRHSTLSVKWCEIVWERKRQNDKFWVIVSDCRVFLKGL